MIATQNQPPITQLNPEHLPVLNTSSYRFVKLSLDQILRWRAQFKRKCSELNLKGTILLAPEGINCFLSGTPESIELFWSELTALDPFKGMVYKSSYSSHVAFKKMKVKLKREIIRMGAEVDPTEFTAPRLAPIELAQWLDEGKEVVLFDTRNVYELEFGSFDKALKLDIRYFRTFPEFVEQLDPSLKDKTVVTFCTGGIRCEKAGAYMMSQGFKDVYQLDGGVLKYFEEVGGKHWNGTCFVFDNRLAVDPNLLPSEMPLDMQS